ncbi:hypothetical protein BASA61_007847 [Batrachochytrium salamandrivorans]|nr:hypothetical protein BASA61_007847 [Batrachochytrium salamandrivorans]
MNSLSDLFRQIGLQKLDTHLWHILLSATTIQIIFLASCWLSSPISHYARLAPTKKASWGMHVVSMIFSLAICTLAVPVFYTPELAADKLFGYSYYSGIVYSIACGYFLWDICVSVYYIEECGIGFVAHAVACFSVFILSFRPFLYYYGSVFLMFEISTVFLNIHWFCDKTGRAGTTLQWVNGIILLTTFFSVRLVFGIYQSMRFFMTCFEQWDSVPKYLFIVYAMSNILLCSLNIFWFSRMIKSVVSRFKGNTDTQGDGTYGKMRKATSKVGARTTGSNKKQA